MKKSCKKICAILDILIVVSLLGGVKVSAQTKSKKMDILFTHDTHSHLNTFSTLIDGKKTEIGGFARIKTLINEKKSKDSNTIVLESLLFFSLINVFILANPPISVFFPSINVEKVFRCECVSCVNRISIFLDFVCALTLTPPSSETTIRISKIAHIFLHDFFIHKIPLSCPHSK